MDPNQNPQPQAQPQPTQPELYAPTTPAMPVALQPDAFAAAPSVQPIQQPTPDAGTQPFAPASQPVAEPQVFAQQAVIETSAQPVQAFPAPTFQGSGPAMPASSRKFPIKLVLSIVGGLVALTGLLVGGWFAYVTFFGGIPLKEYQGSDYSLLVPKDYKQKNDSYGDSVSFEKPNVKTDEQSGVEVSPIAVSESTRTDLISAMDKSLTEDKLNESYGESDGKMTSIKIDKNAKVNGVEARLVSSTIEKDGKKTGSVRLAYILGDKKIYLVIIAAHVSEPGLEQSADKIINSFKIK